MEEDIIVEIILRLPVKSLTRCMRLSKEWKHFISSYTSFRQRYLSCIKGGSPLMLGFFFHTSHFKGYYDEEHTIHFLPTCTEGCDLKAGDQTRGTPALPHHFDESLSFIGHDKIFILASSNGFLLCCLEEYYHMSYYICNPITKECVALPAPNMTSEYNPTGFIYEGSYPYLSLVTYKVVRGIWDDPRIFSNKLTVEIFSSESSEWTVLHLTHSSPFTLMWINPHVVIHGGVVHWLAFTEAGYRCAIVFDQNRNDSLQLIQVPGPKRLCNDLFGESDGTVVYARHNINDLEVWALHKTDGWRKEWSLKYRASLGIPMENHPELFQGAHKNFGIIRFHPWNPQVLYIWNNQKLACFDVENSRMVVLSDIAVGTLLTYFYFPYVWPNWPPFLL